MSTPSGNVTTGQTSSRSTFERPAVRHLARAEGGRELVAGRVLAAQPAQVDDVPSPLAGLGDVVGDGAARPRAGRRVGQDRRVVGVVRRTEQDRLRGRRHGRQRHVAPRGASSCASLRRSARPRGDASAGRSRRARAGRASRQTTSVSSWALSPYASHHARWNAQDENGVAHGFRRRARPRSSRGIESNGRRSACSASGSAVVGVGRPSRGPGQAGSASSVGAVIGPRIASGAVHGCGAQRRWLVPSATTGGANGDR